jgi:hypothetical protein
MDLEAAQQTIEEFINAFTLTPEYFDAAKKPILFLQYVSPNPEGDGLDVVFSVHDTSDPEDPELCALAEKAMTALEAKHGDLPPMAWSIEQSSF